MTERADKIHHDNAPANSAALVQAFFGKSSHHPGLSVPLQSRFGSLRLLDFPKAKIAVESEEICKYDGHKVHKLSQRRLTADWLDPLESDYSQVHSNVSSEWLPSYIKATRPVLEILLKMAASCPDRPRMTQADSTMSTLTIGARVLN